jgi:hypothetical protein
MHKPFTATPWGRQVWRFSTLLLIIFVISAAPAAVRQAPPSAFAQADPRVEEQIEQSWHPAYLKLATGDPTLKTQHGVYEWPFNLDSIGWSMQSYQDYGGTPYFHHGMDMMKIYGTNVFNRSGGQVINVENYGGSEYYWEVAILDPDGYIWQYHHIKYGDYPPIYLG